MGKIRQPKFHPCYSELFPQVKTYKTDQYLIHTVATLLVIPSGAAKPTKLVDFGLEGHAYKIQPLTYTMSSCVET